MKSTIEYCKYLQELVNVNSDTTYLLDHFKTDYKEYLTKIVQTSHERSVWLIKFEPKSKDSILLFYDDNVEYLVKIESDINPESCEIIQITTHELDQIETTKKVYDLSI